jgi:hypothetical protein
MGRHMDVDTCMYEYIYLYMNIYICIYTYV